MRLDHPLSYLSLTDVLTKTDAVDPNEPLFDAPEPAPGAPLLTDTDTKFLSNFFEDMTANQYSMPSFGEGLNFSDAWLDLPPQFMGTATSYGQHDNRQYGTAPAQGSSSVNGHGHGHGNGSLVMPNEPRFIPPPPPPMALAPPQPLSPSLTRNNAPNDVLDAAATLVNNSNGSRRSQNGTNGSVPRRPVPVGHLRHQPLEEFKEEGRRSNAAQVYPDDRAFADWMFAPRERRSSKNASNSPVAPAFQWGSDSAFGDVRGYTPDNTHQTVEAQQKEQLKVLECLERDKSAANTRSNSPVHRHNMSAPLQPPLPRINTSGQHMPAPTKQSEDADAPPRKRRKSRNVRDIEEEDDDTRLPTPNSATKKRISRPVSPPDETPKTSGGRRRKSNANGSAAAAAAAAAAASKGPRENLSEEQKRENHIKSEQKRRTVIKEGFDELCALVPGLRGGGFSKSTMLGMTADHLEEILRGNEVLDKQLESLR